MTVYKVTANQVAFSLKSRGKATKETIVAGLIKGAFAGKVILIKRTPVDEGLMKASWAVIVMPNGAKLINSAPHSGIIEAGSRPHWPNQAAIREWVVRHRKSFGVSKGRGKKGKAAAEAEIDQITFAICRKIAKHGTKPHWVVRGALPKLGRIANKAIQVEIRRNA